jgi:hypothetical protein
MARRRPIGRPDTQPPACAQNARSQRRRRMTDRGVEKYRSTGICSSTTVDAARGGLLAAPLASRQPQSVSKLRAAIGPQGRSAWTRSRGCLTRKPTGDAARAEGHDRSSRLRVSGGPARISGTTQNDGDVRLPPTLLVTTRTARSDGMAVAGRLRTHGTRRPGPSTSCARRPSPERRPDSRLHRRLGIHDWKRKADAPGRARTGLYLAIGPLVKGKLESPPGRGSCRGRLRHHRGRGGVQRRRHRNSSTCITRPRLGVPRSEMRASPDGIHSGRRPSSRHAF